MPTQMAANCAALDGGMVLLGWPNASSPTTINGLVMTAANEFQLNFPRVRKFDVELHMARTTSLASLPLL